MSGNDERRPDCLAASLFVCNSKTYGSALTEQDSPLKGIFFFEVTVYCAAERNPPILTACLDFSIFQPF